MNANNFNLEQLKATWEKIKFKRSDLTPEEEKAFWEQIKPMKKGILTPAEFKAVLDHKFFMGVDLKREVTLEEALIDFVLLYMDAWLREKTARDNKEQAAEIQKHIYLKSKEAGRDMCAEAIEEWHSVHAKAWRDYWESLDHNNIKKFSVTVENPKGLHVRPAGNMVQIACAHDCDIYIHKDGMEHYTIKVDGKPYLNVRTVLAILPLLSLAISKGDIIEFIAYGSQADEAIKSIEKLAQQQLGG
jgi:phosphotransferase system HPr (HPr) family protein